jgi:hypothetical protein
VQTTSRISLRRKEKRLMEVEIRPGVRVLVDDDDAHWVSRHQWSLQKQTLKDGERYKAFRQENNQRIYLHRAVIGAAPREEVGFVNGNTFDCRKSNLTFGARVAERNCNWKGDAAGDDCKRARAHRLYPKLGDCEECGKPATERHHKDGNPGNNVRENIAMLCDACHPRIDGRLDRLAALSRERAGIVGPPQTRCIICDRPSRPLSKGRCHRCKMYFWRTGVERPFEPDADGRSIYNRVPRSDHGWHCGAKKR